MADFRVERNRGYTVMSNHHLRNKELSLKAKGLPTAHSIALSPVALETTQRYCSPFMSIVAAGVV